LVNPGATPWPQVHVRRTPDKNSDVLKRAQPVIGGHVLVEP
jgi:hypothetical protein